jgi:hypothetical protein
LPEDVQRTLAEHEKAGTTDSKESLVASDVYYERHLYAGKRPVPPMESVERKPFNRRH